MFKFQFYNQAIQAYTKNRPKRKKFSKEEEKMNVIKKYGPGLLLCLVIALPCWFFGQLVPVVGGRYLPFSSA